MTYMCWLSTLSRSIGFQNGEGLPDYKIIPKTGKQSLLPTATTTTATTTTSYGYDYDYDYYYHYYYYQCIGYIVKAW